MPARALTSGLWRDWGLGLVGGLVLFAYGIVPTYQPAHFERVYAASGGRFVVLSLPWGAAVDRVTPDRSDLIGGLMCLIGVGLIMYAPR